MASLKPKHPVAALYSEALRALRDRHREEFDEIYKAVKTGQKPWSHLRSKGFDEAR